MAKITQLSQLDLTASYSYADYLTWRLEETVELIKGKISLMAPAPNVNHQRLSMSLSGQLFNYLRHKSCQAFAAPFDVRLYDRRKSILANQEIFTVVQPDICVICDPDKLDEQGCNGAPDWIIEIVSKGSIQERCPNQTCALCRKRCDRILASVSLRNHHPAIRVERSGSIPIALQFRRRRYGDVAFIPRSEYRLERTLPGQLKLSTKPTINPHGAIEYHENR